jgi:hypothetical protein
MNVKVSRSLPLEEIPNHLQELLMEISRRTTDIKNINIPNDLTLGVKLQQLRKKLLEVDMLVEDTISIFKGYNSIISRGENADNDDNATSGPNLPNKAG